MSKEIETDISSDGMLTVDITGVFNKNFNARTDEPEIYEYLDAASVAGINVCLLGPIGVGKTDIIQKYCEARDINCISVITSIEPPIPQPGFVAPWVSSLINKNDRIVLNLTHLTIAKPKILNTYMGLLTEKSISGRDLSHVQIIAFADTNMEYIDPDDEFISAFAFFYCYSGLELDQMEDDTTLYRYCEDNTDKTRKFFQPKDITPWQKEKLMKLPEKYRDVFYIGYTNREMR